MTNWQEVKLGDVCSSISDTYRRKDERVILINTSDVLDGKILNHTPVKNEKLKGQFKKKFQQNDILYSEIRPANKRFAFVDIQNTYNYIASTKLMVLRPNINKILPKFLYCILKSDDIINELQQLAETRSGTFPQITFSAELAPMGILLPPLDTQQKIATVLGVLDDKIELNTKINNNLEQQAQALFKSWFVDFEPFGGKMPNDWKVGKLKDLADVSSGKRPLIKQDNKSIEFSIPLVGASCIMGYTNQTLYRNKILITGRVGTHGIIQRFHDACWPSDNTLVLISRYYEYAYQSLKTINYTGMNRGSTQPLITQTDLKNTEIIIPSIDILIKFEQISGQLMEFYEYNQQENTRLAQIRDTLLPKLMSGKIDVSNVNISADISSFTEN